jgi:hypothetical protein
MDGSKCRSCLVAVGNGQQCVRQHSTWFLVQATQHLAASCTPVGLSMGVSSVLNALRVPDLPGAAADSRATKILPSHCSVGHTCQHANSSAQRRVGATSTTHVGVCTGLLFVYYSRLLLIASQASVISVLFASYKVVHFSSAPALFQFCVAVSVMLCMCPPSADCSMFCQH